MTDEQWQEAIERGKKTSPAKVLRGEYEEMFGHRPKVTVRAGHCPKCQTPLEIGSALQRQNPRPETERAEYTFHSNDNLILARCLKCPKCGHSETLK